MNVAVADHLHRYPQDRLSLEVHPLLGESLELSDLNRNVLTGVAVIAAGIAATWGLAAGLAVIAGTALCVAILRYPSLGAYVSIGAVPLLAGARRGFPIPGFRIGEVLTVVVATCVLLLARKTAVVRWDFIDRLALALAALSVVLPAFDLIANGRALSVSYLSSAFLPLQLFLIFRSIRVGLVSTVQRRFAVKLLLLGSVGVCLVAIAQQMNIGPARFLVERFTDAPVLATRSYFVFPRATGPFQHWHPLAGYLTVIIVLTASLLMQKRQHVLSRRWAIAVVVLAVIALMNTVTFVAMLGVLAGVIWLSFRLGKSQNAIPWLLTTALAAVLLFSPFLLERVNNQYSLGSTHTNSLVPQTLQMRLDVWTDQFLPAMAGHWITGYGPDMPPQVEWTHTESQYLTLFLHGGVVLLVFFGWTMFALFSAARSLTAVPSLDTDRSTTAQALVVLVTVFGLMNLLFPYLTASGSAQIFWALAGVACAGVTVTRKNKAMTSGTVETVQ